MRRKKIALVLQDFRDGGAEKTVLNLARLMQDRGHEVHLFIWEAQFDHSLEAGLTVHHIKPARFSQCIIGFKKSKTWRHYWLARALKRHIRVLEQQGGRFDLVVGTLWPANRLLYYANLPNAYYRVANTLSLELNTLARKQGPAVAARREHFYRCLAAKLPLIAISEGVKADLVAHAAAIPERVTVIYNPVDRIRIEQLAAEAPLLPLPAMPYIIHIARFVPQKRHDLLLAAFRQLITPIQLVLLTKVTPELTALIHQYDLQDRVICPGFQTNPYPWLKQARLSVLCSDHEGLGNVILESLICGVPVVSTDCPSGPREILTGELATWLVPPNDADALAAKIDAALNTSIVIPQATLDRFAPDQIVDQYLSL